MFDDDGGVEAFGAGEPLRGLSLIGAMSGLGVWRLEAGSGRLDWSREAFRIHGLAPGAFAPTLKDTLLLYAPEDQTRLADAIARALQTGEGFALRLTLARKDGETRVLAFRGAAEVDGHGASVAVVGLVQDVTLEAQALAAAQEGRRLAELKAAHAAVAAEVAGLGHWRIEFPSRAVAWSPQMYAVCGLAEGAPVTETSSLELAHPEDRLALIAELAGELQGTPLAAPRTLRIVRPDGEIRWVVGKTHVERDADGAPSALIGTVMDVTRAVEADRRLATSEKRYRVLTENAKDVVVEMTTEGILTYVSPSVLALSGYAPAEVIGRPARDFILDADRLRVEAAARDSLGHGRDAPIEYRIVRKDGTTIWVEARPGVMTAEDGGAQGVTDVVRDISARKVMEAEILAARTQAEAAAAAKSEFLANMSHELRTPLTSIIGFSGLLAPLVKDLPEAKRFTDRIRAASRSLLTTVDDILHVSKLEAGQVEIEAAPAVLDEAFASAIDLVEGQASAKGLTIVYERQPGLPTRLLIDEMRLRQIVLNLLSNAVKFTYAGQVLVRLSPADGGRRLRCEVTDTGPGVPPERLGSLFQRFTQVDASTTRLHGGTGLGLAICKGLVEVMGGAIGVDSVLGEGSRFWFELPLTAAPDAPADVGAETPAGTLDLTGLRVLAVDDNPANLELVRLILAAVGAEVAEAGSGEDGVGLARLRPFDAILMDLRMPGLDGYAAARAIQAGRGPNRETPILSFSANVEAGGVAPDNPDLFDGHVSKPIDARGLLRALLAAAGGTLGGDDGDA